MNIFEACLAGNLERVRELIAAGVNFNAAQIDGETPLILAATGNHRNITALLLAQAGINVRAVDSLGRTALHEAARLGDLTAAELLIAKGADVNAAQIDGETPLSKPKSRIT